MSASSHSVEKRRAWDGARYTYREFEEYYGFLLGRDMWRRCSARNEDDVNISLVLSDYVLQSIMSRSRTGSLLVS